tara:strand:+ start:207 stop:395 length:189 start_codon:yes stop_codon:yes gene_type:complete
LKQFGLENILTDATFVLELTLKSMMDINMLMLSMGFAQKVILEDAPVLKQGGRRSAEVAELW